MTGTKMRPIRQTIPFKDALALVEQASVPLNRIERVDLQHCVGRVLATSVVADRDVPPFNRAAMDGYAVVAGSTFGAKQGTPALLDCIETVHTGSIPSQPLVSGQCIQIATGAPMPEGADAVVMVEETDRQDETRVAVFAPVHPGQHVGRRAADIASGAELLHPGDLLTPSRIGSIAALGIADIDVYARPRVAILSTGDEIIAPGQPLGPGQIYDINRFTLGSVICEHGGLPVPLPTAPDDLDELSAVVDDCLEHDILVFSGGSSVGERDLTVDVIREKGKILFHGIAVKPGKPTVFGTIGSTPVLGMPGYPTSCLSNAYMLLVPLLRLLARLPAYRFRTLSVPAAQRFISTTGRHQFYTVRVLGGMAVPAFKASGDITSMSQADGYIEIPAEVDAVEEGETVEVKLF